MIKKLSHFVMKVEIELFCVLLSVVANCEWSYNCMDFMGTTICLLAV